MENSAEQRVRDLIHKQASKAGLRGKVNGYGYGYGNGNGLHHAATVEKQDVPA